jgi:hypothetical protein
MIEWVDRNKNESVDKSRWVETWLDVIRLATVQASSEALSSSTSTVLR